MEFNVRSVLPGDNEPLARIIRNTLLEFNAARPGTVYFDPTTDHMYDIFREKGSWYYVAVREGVIAGGAGIYPTKGLDKDTCELVKFYLDHNARGQGIGKKLLSLCIETAKVCGYKKMYLETMPELIIAVPLYERTGFKKLPGPLGESGHTGCGIWMLKELF